MKLCKVAAAIWVCLILVVEAGPVDVGFSMDEETTYETYNKYLVLPIRDALTSSFVWDTIPSMPDNKVGGLYRYGLVRIKIQQMFVTVVIDINNLYVVGFHSNNPTAKPTPNAYYYLTERQGDKVIKDGYKDAVGLFQGATDLALGYEGSYIALGSRTAVPLGKQPFINAISALYYRKTGQDTWKKWFLVIIQMVSEAVRSGFVANGVKERFEYGEDSPPDDDILAVENSWLKSSNAVRGADKATGNLAEPIVLPCGKEINTINDVKEVELVSLLCPSYLDRPLHQVPSILSFASYAL
ncbi:hypothetical protein Tsubulata_011482 [Turnera subulata]|uniref:rRNA N-glycosylase n=1 Tax=Turnera subulata TaxID=218843 RepID=A0A9Q0GJ19_9ROSI|nr:hypothetical protein Tsubulata_011482 [Turnera subulata]